MMSNMFYEPYFFSAPRYQPYCPHRRCRPTRAWLDELCSLPWPLQEMLEDDGPQEMLDIWHRRKALKEISPKRNTEEAKSASDEDRTPKLKKRVGVTKTLIEERKKEGPAVWKKTVDIPSFVSGEVKVRVDKNERKIHIDAESHVGDEIETVSVHRLIALPEDVNLAMVRTHHDEEGGAVVITALRRWDRPQLGKEKAQLQVDEERGAVVSTALPRRDRPQLGKERAQLQVDEVGEMVAKDTQKDTEQVEKEQGENGGVNEQAEAVDSDVTEILVNEQEPDQKDVNAVAVPAAPFHLEVAVPGFAPEEVKVKVTGDRVTVMAEQEHEENGVYLSRKFRKEFSLPEGVHGDDIKSRLETDAGRMLLYTAQ